MAEDLRSFRELLGKVVDLRNATAVLEWDQQTYMPPGGSEGRSHQIATLSQVAHERFVSDEFGEALQEARQKAAECDPDSDDARLVKYVSREFDKKRKVPPEWVGEFGQATSRAQAIWQEARQEADFSRFAPSLQKIVAMRRQYADFFAPYDFIYDPLLDDYEPGMKTADMQEVFNELHSGQLALVKEILDHGDPVDTSLLHLSYDTQKQWDFAMEIIERFGFDFQRGRQDRSAHPFTTAFSLGDVRITTRIYSDYLPSGLFATLHECGHALYEQGVKASLDRTPLTNGASLGVHESQSRLWENLVGRSRSFWHAFYPRLQEVFPAQLGSTGLENFYRAINKVEPSLIRVEADEATYNLHIMLRFDLEIALIRGEIAIPDLPQAWNEKMREYLGIEPSDEAEGVLQDVHWSAGLMGYFPTYTLGNLIASQLWEKIEEDISDIEAQIAKGSFSDLLEWLRENVHQHGAKFEPIELIQRATGRRLRAEPYLRYLRRKFSEIYRL